MHFGKVIWSWKAYCNSHFSCSYDGRYTLSLWLTIVSLKLKGWLQFTLWLFIGWQVYTLPVINHCERLIAIHTFGMFIRWQEGLFCNWHDINELVSKWNVQIQTKVRHALVGGPIWYGWLVLFSHWSVDFWLMDWLANRIFAFLFLDDLLSVSVWNSTATLATPLDGFNTYFLE